ncbi:hypothetical protein [Haliangium ochraceum]|nr:hypothetical protein [Haliangium ochraceum]
MRREASRAGFLRCRTVLGPFSEAEVKMKLPPLPKSTPPKGITTKHVATQAVWAQAHSRNQTSSAPERILREQSYRIALLGFWPSAPERRGMLHDAYTRIFENHAGPRIALHAGALFTNEPWPTRAEVDAVARQHRVAALFEASNSDGRGAYRAFSPVAGALPVEIYQRFATSEQANADPAMVAELVKDCGPYGERTVYLDGMPIGLFVCGEINILTNVQTQGNVAHVRHDPTARVFGHNVPIVFNGAHTTMGNWGKLERRFHLLSQGGRWAFHVTNCDNANWGRSTVRAYYDGQRVATSAREAISTSIPAGVHVQRISDASDERYIALVLDIPGVMLTPERRAAVTRGDAS